MKHARERRRVIVQHWRFWEAFTLMAMSFCFGMIPRCFYDGRWNLVFGTFK